MARPRLLPLAAAGLAFLLALLQRPGERTADTKIDLHVDPVGFLADVALPWSPTGDLGHVHSGQYSGYLWPMGPFFAAGNALGLPEWLVQRLWLGLLLALAAWGAIRLMDELRPGPRGLAQAVAAAAIVLNPYTVVFANRTSVTLLAYAALPWLLVCVHRGLRDPRGWWWPAAFALVFASTGGGVNAAVTAWLLVGPALLLLYEPLLGAVRGRDAAAFGWRTAAFGVLASLWWAVPVLVQAGAGIDFLEFIEQPGTIWSSTSASEALRLMGYWIAYGVSFGGRRLPLYESADTLLFSAPVVVATLVVPALALAGFVWTRRWRYGPFFLMLAVVGVLVVMAGFPDGTPLRKALQFTYNRVEAVQFLRTTYKAAPLVAVGSAMLLGVAVAEARRRFPPGRLAAVALGGGLALLLALSAWPLVTGRAVELEYDGVPQAWRAAADDLDRELPDNHRALVLPGQLFSFYRWGGTVDPILPVLSERPVALRTIVPYADLRSTDYLWTLDALVQQARLYPGELPPLLALAGAGAVISASDDDSLRSGSRDPAEAARELAAEGLDRPVRRYGPGRAGLPQVRRHDLAGGRGLVRAEPISPPTVVDGSAETLAELAAFRELPDRRPILYAADLSRGELAAAGARGAQVAIGDGNRRRAYVNPLLRQNMGFTLPAWEDLSEDGAMLDPFGRGPDAQTVAVYRGLRAVRAPFSPGGAQYPERRPYAALDGDPATAWVADRALAEDRRWLELVFERPRDVPWLELVPLVEDRGAVTEVEVAGRRFQLRPGVNRLPLGLRGAERLRVLITGVRRPPGGNAPGGIRELRLPGLRVEEHLRVPRLAERALARRDLRRTSLSYLFARTTGDEPLRRGPRRGRLQALDASDPGDAELALRRLFSPPLARAWALDGWASAVRTPDPVVDRLAGTAGPPFADSSGRHQGRPGERASRAFDGDPRTGWLGVADYPLHPWISWRSSRPVAVARLRLRPGPDAATRPRLVRLRTAGGASAPARLGPGGEVRLDRPLRGREFRLEVLAPRRAPVGIGELEAPGAARSPAGDAGPVRSRCGDARVRVDGRLVPVRVSGEVAGLDAGRPLRAAGCRGLRLPAGPAELSASRGPLALDLLRLRSPAPAGLPRAVGGGRVLDPGEPGRGSREGVRLALTGPSWLVLGESYNAQWRATCDGRELGPPEPIDGFANGWRVGAGCSEASFSFASNRAVIAAYLVSALACLALVALLLVRRPAPRRTGPEPDLPAADGRPWPWRRALLAGLAAGAVLGFVFALRAGLVLGPLLFLVLWRGVPTRWLVLAAGGLLGVLVPLLYLATPTGERGFDLDYATDHLAAHWATVGALALLLVALVRTVSTAIRASRARAPAGAGAPPTRP